MNDIVTHLRNSACGNDCRCAYCVRNKIAADEIEQLRELLGVTERLLTSERDEARRVLKSIVEEFVQHAQTMNPFYPATPMHECEFSWNPECGKCDACEAWGDYVRICHPTTDTEEDETP